MKKSFITFCVSILATTTPVIVEAATLANPLGSVTDPNVLISNIIRVVLGVVAILALVIIIYGGIEILISAGNEDRVKRGRDSLMWAFIGLLIVFGSYGIIQAVFKALGGESII
jgi:hypothetical protein